MIPAIGPKRRAASCGQRAGHRGDDPLGQRVDQLGQAGRVLSTHSTRDHAAVPLDARRQLGHLVEPQVGQPQRLGDGGPLGLGRRLVAGGELADRALPGQVPVHRAAGPAHQLLQLGEQRHLAEQVLGGAAAGDAAEQRAEAERVAGRVAARPGPGARDRGREARSRTARHSCVHGRRVIIRRSSRRGDAVCCALGGRRPREAT